MINKERLARNFSAIISFSAPGEGVTRLAFSDEDWAARQFILDEMTKAGLSITVDPFGNITGRRKGSYPDLPAVMLGSHIDSVPAGGNFDGVAGILTALEVIHALAEEKFPNHHPIEITLFMAEESSRFGVATLGSKAMTGQLSAEELKKIADKDGNTLYSVLTARGLKPDNIKNAVYKKPLKAFLELHIEQGKVLETTGDKIGVVTGIAAPTRLKALIHGHADHSGATPMNMRKDGLAAAAQIILLVEDLAKNIGQSCVGTVGVVKAQPNVMNVIPGEVELGIDLRSIHKDAKTTLAGEVKAVIADVAKQRGLDIAISVISDDEPVVLPESMTDFLSDICDDLNIKHIKMPSGAGHDAMHMAMLASTGMLFIPCKGGISHHKDEYADMDDIVRGAEVLLLAVKKLSMQETKL